MDSSLGSKPSLWPIWAGFLFSLVAFGTVPVFARYLIAPWANLLLFAVAMVLVVVGLRRAFAPGRKRVSKISGSILAGLSVTILALFIFMAFVLGRQLPGSSNAPKVGQKAPEFTLPDANGNNLALSDLLTTPVNGHPTKGVLLVFYRGYW